MSSTGNAPAREGLTNEQENGSSTSAVALQPVETNTTATIAVQYLQLFWEHRRLLWRVGIGALLASAAIALLIPVSYDSATRLMPPDGGSAAGGMLGMLAAMVGHSGSDLGGGTGSGALGGFAADLLGLKSSGALFVGIAKSDTVQDNLIEQFNLKKVYSASKIEDARLDLATHTDVSEDRKSGIITITVTDHDPKRASDLANGYVAELNRLVESVSTSSARRERIFLEARLQAVKTEWDRAARNFSEFASKNTAIDIPTQSKAMVESAATLQGYLIAAESELKGLREIYSDNNFRVRATQARVQELRNKLNEIGGGDTSGDTGEGSLYPSIRKLPLLGVTYVDLYRQAKIEETVYELLTQEYELAKVQEAKEIPSVKVLDRALVPTKRSFPPRRLITVFGTILGLGAAMVCLVVKTRWDAMDAADPRKVLATQVLATVRARVPQFSRNGVGSRASGQRRWSWARKRDEVPQEDQGRNGQ